MTEDGVRASLTRIRPEGGRALFTYLWLACAASNRVERAAFAACLLRRLLLPALAGQSLPDSLNLRLQIPQVSF